LFRPFRRRALLPGGLLPTPRMLEPDSLRTNLFSSIVERAYIPPPCIFHKVPRPCTTESPVKVRLPSHVPGFLPKLLQSPPSFSNFLDLAFYSRRGAALPTVLIAVYFGSFYRFPYSFTLYSVPPPLPEVPSPDSLLEFALFFFSPFLLFVFLDKYQLSFSCLFGCLIFRSLSSRCIT